VSDGETLIGKIFDCYLLLLKWILNTSSEGDTLEPFAEAVVEISKNGTLVAFRLVRDSLVDGTLPADLTTRINDLVGFLTIFVDNLTGGGFFPSSVFSPFMTALVTIMGLFMSVFGSILTSVIGNTFIPDFLGHTTSYFSAMSNFLALISDDVWPNSLPAFVELARCATISLQYAMNVEDTPASIPSPLINLNYFFIQIGSCTRQYVDQLLAQPAIGTVAYQVGLAVRDLIDCFFSSFRELFMDVERGNFLKWDCHFCSHPSIDGGDCSPVDVLSGSGCREYTLDLLTCSCAFIGDILDAVTTQTPAVGSVVQTVFTESRD